MKPQRFFCLLAFLVLSLSACKDSPTHKIPTAPKVPEIQQGIQGKATISLKEGHTNPLDGLELLLCKPEAEKVVIETRDAKWLEIATPRSFGNGYENLDLPSIGRAALPFEVQRTKTDGFGQFAFADTPPGSYLVYAQYKSRYPAGYWLIPIKVEAGKVTKLDISNANFKEIYNRDIQR